MLSRTKFIAMFTCADVLEQREDSNGDVSSGDDSAYEGEGIVGYLPKATSFMPDADELSGGTEDMHDMDLDASAMDQDGERPGEGSLCDSLWQVV